MLIESGWKRTSNMRSLRALQDYHFAAVCSNPIVTLPYLLDVDPWRGLNRGPGPRQPIMALNGKHAKISKFTTNAFFPSFGYKDRHWPSRQRNDNEV